MPVNDMLGRACVSVAMAVTVLQHARYSRDFVLELKQALWIVLFMCSFKGGTGGVLWPKDFTFHSKFHMSCHPDVLKRTSEEFTKTPRQGSKRCRWTRRMTRTS